MPISDIYNQLKSKILGTQTLDIDTQLDSAVKDILQLKTYSGRLSYVELLKNLAGKQQAVSKFDWFSPNANPAFFGQGDRLQRYKSYESMIRNISYCYRALNVIVDNIISPDDITKRSLDVKLSSDLGEDEGLQAFVGSIKEIMKKTKLENNLDIIIRSTLLYGDFFVEVGNSETALTSRAYLAESQSIRNLIAQREIANFDINIKMKDKDREKEKDITFKIFNMYINEDKTPSNGNGQKEGKDISDVHLLFHHPEWVVKLQSSLFSVCFGYLIFPRYDNIVQSAGPSSSTVDNVCNQILKNLANMLPNYDEFKNNEDLKAVISSILSKVESRSILNVRFVPPNRMQHFKLPSTKFYPYGESVFYPVEFLAKLLISLETALTVHRISRSTEKRIIGVEIGLPRDAKKLIEGLKEEFRKRKVSIGSYGQLDTIPSTISTFEDIYVPMKDGRRFVEIDTFNAGGVDVRGKVDELAYIRDSIIAALNVPPAFIGLETNLSNKAALSEENISFTRSIINYQKILSGDVEELVHKLLELTFPEETLAMYDEINIAFQAPKSLQYERQARHISDIVNMIESLERIGISKEYSKKKYLPDIDWQEVESDEVTADIEKITNKSEEGEAGMGGFGGPAMGAI